MITWSEAHSRPPHTTIVWDAHGTRWNPVRPDSDSFASIILWAPADGSLAPLSWIEMLPYGPFTDTDPLAPSEAKLPLSSVEHYTEAARILAEDGESFDPELRMICHALLALAAATALSINRNKPTVPDDWKDALG